MKIVKFLDFINEDNVQDTPEEYIKTTLVKLQKTIESFFEDTNQQGEEPNIGKSNMASAIERGKEIKKDESKMSFKDLGIKLDSSELSKYSAIYDSLTIKYSDEDSMYNLYITIPLEEGINKDKTKDFSDQDIKKCSYKFKKYDQTQDFALVGQLGPKTIDISEINEEFLVNLKIELDDQFGGDEEKLEIET